MAETPVVETIKIKVDQLIDDNRRLRKHNEKITEQRDKLKAENRLLEEKAAALEKRITILELKEGFGGQGEDTKTAKARVNRLMREVDKCIALLNR